MLVALIFCSLILACGAVLCGTAFLAGRFLTPIPPSDSSALKAIGRFALFLLVLIETGLLLLAVDLALTYAQRMELVTSFLAEATTLVGRCLGVLAAVWVASWAFERGRRFNVDHGNEPARDEC